MITVNDIITKLQQLDPDNLVGEINIEPIVTDYENTDGTGVEVVKYLYTIEIEDTNTKTRRYVNNHGVKEYINKE